jgi:hypothetical protein
MNVDVVGPDPQVIDELLGGGGSDLVVIAPCLRREMNMEAVGDHFEHSIDIARVMDGGHTRAQAADGPGQHDRSDLIRGHGDQLRLADARIRAKRRSHILLDAGVIQHAPPIWGCRGGLGGSTRVG